MKVGDINVPVKVTIDKKQLHKIMQENILKEDIGDNEQQD